MKIFFLLVLVISVFTTALQIVISQHQSRKTFMEVQNLETYRNELNEEWGRLQLEQSTWATDDRIERIAREQLSMNPPESDTIVLLIK
jgi:cell division protein FtsL